MKLEDVIKCIKADRPDFLDQRNCRATLGDIEIPWKILLSEKWNLSLDLDAKFKKIIDELIPLIQAEGGSMTSVVEEEE